ncbi:hypothetical protein [Paenibacillus crassostreae]|uniref:Uncharacterized protein n=1 Tax=Paenibacillus crassostreae TaxID=1763538 RepID=A0A167C5T0_9BACL|nr:hypothetical protein [Paenibacillus crassostreae]AOZ91614.1 hypothetical protein LPB68_04875 [Paenibacillus crassostreae]OAB72812.1 hypothetical protein PNBC_15375 [Paenibacillus crassostreae]
MVKNSLSEIMESLKKARENLNRIKASYQDNNDLLNFYEPSAKYLVGSLEKQLSEILQDEVACKLYPDDKEVDLWIRIDGEQFHNGKGPIGSVGNFLNKLASANRQAINVISKVRKIDFKSQFNGFSDSFDLTATATGSLKLGLKKPEMKLKAEEGQLDIFTFAEDPWEKFKESAAQNEIITESMNLLLSAIASAENEEIFNELTEKYEEKDLLKIIHYAKQVVPSAQSNIETVSFEIQNLNVSQRYINTTKETRKLLSKQAKRLVPDKEYITGSGTVRGMDLDDRSLIIRPLVYEETTHDEIKCYFTNVKEDQDLEMFLNKRVDLTGFIIYSSNNKLLRLEIEEITETNIHN